MSALPRRQFLYLSALTGAAALLPPTPAAASPESLYRRSIVIDGLGFPGGRAEPAAGLTVEDLEDIRQSGVTAVHMTIGSVGTMPPLQAFEHIVRDIVRWEQRTAAQPDTLRVIRSVAELRATKAAGLTGLVFGLQDGVAFEDDPERLDALHHFGVRVIQPTYNRRNLLGDGCMEPADAGLSLAGKDAIVRMNELGIMVDLSHCGRRTAADAIAVSSAPVSFTHTGCHALVEHPRHRSDEEMKQVADSGGVVGIYIMPYLARGKQPTAADVVAHIEHALNVVGEDHVSIGTDGNLSSQELTPEYIERFREVTRDRRERGIAAPHETEEGYLFASDLNTPRRLETLAGLLLERGHGAARVEKILGANLTRVFEASWKA